MLVYRKKLIDHLSKINCGGLLKDTVLHSRFACRGFSVNQDLFLSTGDCEWATPLASEVGVVNLELLIKVLEIGDDEKISFDVEGQFLVLQSSDRVIKLVTAAPRVIGSRAEPHLVEHVMAMIPAEAKWVHLGARLVNGIQEAIQKLSAENVLLFASPSGTRVVVGEEKQNSITFQFPELVAASDYQLVFHSALVAPVFKQVTDYTKAEICLTGANSVVPIREGAYMFVISPAKEV